MKEFADKYKYWLIGIGIIVAFVIFYFVFKKKALEVPKVQNNGNNTNGTMSAIGYKAVTGIDGDKDQSFLNIANAPRGVRNNNPLNVKDYGDSWLGRVPKSQSQDNVFLQFVSYAYGIRCALYLLDKRYFGEGKNTVTKIITKWDFLNNNYITFVSQQSGYQPNQVLTFSKETAYKLLSAMAIFENRQAGQTNPVYITKKQFDAAWELYQETK